MYLMRIGDIGAERPVVRVDDTHYIDVSDAIDDFDEDFFARDGLRRLESIVARRTNRAVPFSGERIGAPIPRPHQIVCIGLNFSDHAAETGQAVPREPIIFSKSPNTLIGPNDDVRIPRGATKPDWEVELGIVIGRRTTYLKDIDDAHGAVAGFVLVNDVSERAFQLEREGQWMKGKSAETFNPAGPWLATPDEIPNILDLGMWLDVNGVRRQTGSTATMIFDPYFIVHYLSQFMVLEPGDLINTGTPPGVGMGFDPPVWLQDGDVVDLGIDRLGAQRQKVVGPSTANTTVRVPAKGGGGVETATMRAVSQEILGGPEVLTVIDAPRPEPRTNEVLVRVHAASVNPTDWKHRATGHFLGRPPFVLGWDLSGVVEAVGVGVARFAVGDEIFGMLSYPFGHGSHAEYVVAPARWFARKPASLSHIQAAALPLVSTTAWQALVEYAGLQVGQRVLIHAAAGGVGHIAVQIAKAHGAYVIGTSSEAKHGFLRSIGVDEPIDYRTTDFTDAVADVDVVLDTVGGDYSLRSLRVLRPGGMVVSTLPIGSEEFYREAERLGVRAVRMLVDSSHEHMAAIAQLAEENRLAATIAETFPLADVAAAHRLGETNRTTGKIVLTLT